MTRSFLWILEHPAVRVAALALTLVSRRSDAAESTPPINLFTIGPRTLQTSKGAKVEADTGTLMVRENRSVSGSRVIPIRFLRLHSRAASPRAPLFFLAGGPGDRAVSDDPETVEFWTPFLGLSDVVLIDQRGVADADLRWRWDGPIPTAFFVSADSALKHVEQMNRRGAQVIRGRGVDLAGYNTRESAADLDQLRAALKIERVSLLAFSYGTHLACCYLRDHGKYVENAVLLGLEGPDQTNKLPWTMDLQFQKLALLAANDPQLANKVPDLMALYDRVIAKLTREPMIVAVPSPSGKDTLRVPIGPFGLRYILRADIGDATDLIVFPRLLWSIDHGDASVLSWFVRKRAGVALAVRAMNEAMDSASGTSRGRRAMIDEQSRASRFADVINFPYPQAEATWGVPDLGDAFRAPLVSPVRTLLVSGSLDCNTPPQQAEELRWGMSNATHLIVENAGHEQTFWQNETAVPVVVDFLAGKDVRDRKITYPPLKFVALEGADSHHPAAARP